MALFLERMLAPLLPGWALRRAAARVQFDGLLAMRGYDAGKVSRSTRNWRTAGSSAAAEDGPALAMLRNRSRDLVRNNNWARKARRQLPAHMVGTGVVPRPDETAAERTSKRALSAWSDWAEATDEQEGLGFYAQQDLLVGTVVESGEALLIWTPNAKAPGGWTTQVLEGDYLDEQHNEMSRNGSGRIINGVEFDARGRRVAYHLRLEHPGDPLSPLGAIGKRVRVEARFVDHVFERLRAGQVRGVPWLAASMLGLRDMDDYLGAERMRKKIAAALAIFIKGPANTPRASPLGEQVVQSGRGGSQELNETIKPGTIKRLGLDEDIVSVTPPRDQGLTDYLRWEMLAISAGIGLPYAELTGDLSTANYGSMRAGKLEFWTLLDRWQWLMLVPQLLRPAWNRVQATAGVPGLRCEWGFPKRPWVDPLKDAQAELIEARGGLTPLTELHAGRGYTTRQVFDAIRHVNDLADQLGLILDSDPRRTAKNGAASTPGAGSDGAAPDDTTTT
ncbi:phage portal protein [Rhodovarius crocodyli]|nr:phage portal protein [Rhodovarius crocodyli]